MRPGVRFVLFIVLVVGGFLILRVSPLRHALTLDEMLRLLEELRGVPGAAPLFVGTSVLLSTFGMPATPVVLAGGAVFGFASGFAISFGSLFLGALSSYALGRFLARDFVVQTLGSRTEPIERLLKHHAFWAVVRLRILPAPFALVNYAASLAGMGFGAYVGATILGLLPATLVLSYFASALVDAAESRLDRTFLTLAAASLLFVALTFVPTVIRGLRRRRRRSSD